MDKEKIIKVIYDAIEEINDQLPKSRKLEKTPDTILFGTDGKLDSLGLVNLIVAVENIVDEELDETITLADEKAMSLKNSPFRTVTTLAEYVQSLIG